MRTKLTRKQIASRAGSATSPRKAETSKQNGKLGAKHGKKGGRPRNEQIVAIMRENNCSRAWAYCLLKAPDKITIS